MVNLMCTRSTHRFENAFEKKEAIKYYARAKDYVKENFIKESHNSEFIGCVRNNIVTHEYINYDKMDMPCRSDLYHDVVNIFINYFENY
jgi:hypothetical protein